jgi:hypothetical protein
MKMVRQDDFSLDTKELLAKRVGTQCSNPNCRQPTSGPSSDPTKALNIGVAAHITAAASGGPRYNPDLTTEERRSPDNGIWCCQNCAKLIDNDEMTYTVDALGSWKNWAEEAARLAIDSPAVEPTQVLSDEDLIKFYAQCFDRDAFRVPFVQEGSMPAFDRAMEDTIFAISTGCIRSPDGHVSCQARGKAYLRDPDLRNQMDSIVDLLRAIRSRYELGRKMGFIQTWESNGQHFHCVNDRYVADWMDHTRSEILRMFSVVAERANVMPPSKPKRI